MIDPTAHDTSEGTGASAPMPAAARERAPGRACVTRCVAFAALVSAGVFPARDVAAAAPALAQVLFEEGRALMARGRTEEACAKFAESNRLDPATGTLLNLAVCNESRGKTATAWEQFRAAEAASQYNRREDRVRFAREHIAKLEPRLSRITLRVPEAQQVLGLDITLDGVQLEQAAWNVATPIDPGEHVVVARAPGRAARTWPLSVRPGASTVSVVIELEPVPAVVQTDEGPRAAASERGRDSSLSTTKLLAYASGGLGAAGLIGGVVFGAQAFSRWDERNRLCPGDVCATPEGQRAQGSAEGAARNANIAVGIGLVSLAAGAVFYLLPESDKAAGAPRQPSEPSDTSLSLSWDAVLSAGEVRAVARGSW